MADKSLLADGFFDVPAGRVATVVTHLEMLSPPSPRDVRPPEGIAIRRVVRPETDWYRDLYTRVGRDWLWFSRLQMSRQALATIIEHPDVEVYALTSLGRDEGLLELDFRRPGECELAFFGLTPALIGKGAGRHLMQTATKQAWLRSIHRFWVHTCTLDHPGALGFYRRSGFVPFAQQIEIAEDPRLRGDLPMSAGPHVPIFKP